MVDATAKRARELAGYAKHLGLTEVPDVQPIRFVSPDEQAGYHAACMAEQGYPADADGMYGAAPGQDEAIALALYTCAARYPLADKYEQPYTVAQKRIIYDHFKNELIPCFTARGVEVPPLPVFETFLAGIGTALEYNPHAYVDNLTGPQMRELEQACPFLPPAEQCGDDRLSGSGTRGAGFPGWGPTRSVLPAEVRHVQHEVTGVIALIEVDPRVQRPVVVALRVGDDLAHLPRPART